MPQTFVFRLLSRTKPSGLDPNPGPWQEESAVYSDDPDTTPTLPGGRTSFDPNAYDVRIVRDVMDIVG